jgi:hypothetical protein
MKLLAKVISISIQIVLLSLGVQLAIEHIWYGGMFLGALVGWINIDDE